MTPTDTATIDPAVPADVPRITEPRDYIVFQQVTHEGHATAWEDIGLISAHNRDEALELIVGALPEDEQDGVFVAVSARHWRPARPVVETTVKRTWAA